MSDKENSGIKRDLTKDQKIINSGETNQKLIAEIEKELCEYEQTLKNEVDNLKFFKTAQASKDPVKLKESEEMVSLLALQKARVRMLINQIGTKQLKKVFDEAKTNEAQVTAGIRKLKNQVNDKAKTVKSLKTKIADFEKEFKFLFEK